MSPSFWQFGDFVNFDESKLLLVSSPVLGSTEDKKLNLPHYYVNTDVSYDFTPRSRGVVSVHVFGQNTTWFDVSF